MSKIDEMLKNEKVEWKKLGEVCEIIKGKQFNRKHMLEDGKYPVINGGISPSGFVNVFNTNKNCVTVSQGGASAGYVNFIETDFWLGAHAFAAIPKSDKIKEYGYNHETFNKFIFYILKNNQLKLQDSKVGAGIPSISKDDLSKIKIPITSIKIQDKIVNYLDEFTDYAEKIKEKLQKELNLRNKQYEYYRDKLLSEEHLNKLINKYDLYKYELRETTLGEIGKFTRGNGLQKKDFIDNGYPVIHYGEIYTKYGFEAKKTFSYVSKNIFDKLKKAKQGDLLIATTSENLKDVGKTLVWKGVEEVGFSGDMYCYTTNENSKFIAYYLQTNVFQKQKEMKVTGTKLIRIHGDDMEKFKITLPPIEIQEKIVEILDKFQALTQYVSGLLPDEIEEREKQYEYYREKLLTFNTECTRGGVPPIK